MNDPDAITLDAFLNGRLMLRQPRRGHRAGHDAILLAAATRVQAGDRVIDFGAGVGTAGLAVARRVAGLDLVLVENNPSLAELARENAVANQLQAQIAVLDVTSPAGDFAAAGLPADHADAVLMNPPFNDPARHRGSPDAARSHAHQATESTLDGWVHTARRVLKPGGTLTLIWRADGLSAVLAALSKGFGSLVVLPVHPDATAPAIRIIVTAEKGGRAPLMLYPGLVLNDGAGASTPAVRAVLGGTGLLPLSRADCMD